MILHGREIKFLKTVWAVNEISKVCPQNKISNLNQLLNSKDTSVVNETWATFICALANGYEMAQKYEDKEYQPNKFTKEEVLCISEEDFGALIGEATQAWFADRVTVEVEESKGKKNETSETSD